MGKSFDTFAPIGPCIATADETVEPNDLAVKLWNDAQFPRDYNTDEMEHRVPEIVEFATLYGQTDYRKTPCIRRGSRRIVTRLPTTAPGLRTHAKRWLVDSTSAPN